jgi:hypothetical protein
MGGGWLSVYTGSKTHTRHAARGEVGRRRRREKSAPRRHAPAAAATAVRRAVAEGPAHAESTGGGPLRVRHHLGQAALLKSKPHNTGPAARAAPQTRARKHNAPCPTVPGSLPARRQSRLRRPAPPPGAAAVPLLVVCADDGRSRNRF